MTAKYPRARLAAANPDDDDWATYMNAIVTEVNQLRQDVTENEIMQEKSDVSNIHLHLSAIGNVMGVRDESTDPRPIKEHLKLLGASTNALSENASLVDVRVEELEKTSLVMEELEKTSLGKEEHSGVMKLFGKYKLELALADLGLEIFAGVQAYLNPLTIWHKTWSTSQGLMKGLDEKMQDVKKRVFKIARDVVAAGAG